MSERRKIPKGIEVYEISESCSLWALHRYWTVIRMIGKTPKGIIVVLTKVHFLGQSDLHLFKSFSERCYREKVKLILVGVQSQFLSLIQKEGLYDLIGPRNIVKDMGDAIQRSIGKQKGI